METTATRKTWRRPFLHLVILYAGDQRVLRYAREIQNTFLDRSIDVILQTELPGGGRIKSFAFL